MSIMGSLATLGYADKQMARELPGILIVNPRAYLVDTRLDPYCKWSPLWQRKGLEAGWGERYLYRGDWLGNVHHRDADKPIQLADEERGISWLIRGLERGYTLLLLCGCAHYERCHRKVIYELVKARLGDELLDCYELNEPVMTPLGLGVINPAIPLEVHRARNRYGVHFQGVRPQHYFHPSQLQRCLDDSIERLPVCFDRERSISYVS